MGVEKKKRKKSREEISTIYLFIFRAFDIHSRSNILNRRVEAYLVKHRLSGVVQYSLSFNLSTIISINPETE